MNYKTWHLATMEENGYGATSTAIVNKVANYLALHGSDSISNEEFIHACYACNADPYSFTEKDLVQLQRRLNELT